MGGELAQESEWSHEATLEWHLRNNWGHAGVGRCIADLNALYRDQPAMHQLDCEGHGFEWVEASDTTNTVLAFLRHGEDGTAPVLAVFNLTPVVHHGYRLGVPAPGRWVELLNTDADFYGGSGVGNLGGVDSMPIPSHGRYQSVLLEVPWTSM